MAIYVKAGETFDVTGHYPILAGFDSTGEPLYVAATENFPFWPRTSANHGLT